MFVDNILANDIPATTPILLPICTGTGCTGNLRNYADNEPCDRLLQSAYGINLFVASSISKVSIEELTRKILKPLLALIVVLLLITYIPAFTMIFLNK